MITYRRAAATALAVLTTAALAMGCTHDPNPSVTTATPIPGSPTPTQTIDRVSSPAPTTTPTPTHAPLSAAEQGKADAGQAVVKFWRVTDTLAINPYTSLNQLATVSRGQTIDPWRQMLIQRRIKDERQKGHVTATPTRVTYEGNNFYAVKACIDVSKVDLVDKHGHSVVNRDGPPRVSYDYTVQQASDGHFYVVKDTPTETC